MKKIEKLYIIFLEIERRTKRMIERDRLHYENRLARLMTNPVENANLIRKVRRHLRKQK